MQRQSLVALGICSVLLLGAGPPAIPGWVPTANLDVTAEISPGGQIQICVGEWERFFVGLRVEASSLLGLRTFNVGARPADIAILVDGRLTSAPHAFYTVVPMQFNTTGRHTIRIEPSNLDWGLGAGSVSYHGASVDIDVIECHYLVETRGIIHMNDGGWQPVLGGTIDSTKLSWNAAGRQFIGTGTETNVAVAYPNGGCTARFAASPSAAHLSGYAKPDGLTFHLDIEWDRSTARLEAQGVRCLVAAGGRINTFIIKRYAGDLPVGGVSTANARLEPWTIDTDRRVYTGFIWVTLTRVRGP